MLMMLTTTGFGRATLRLAGQSEMVAVGMFEVGR